MSHCDAYEPLERRTLRAVDLAVYSDYAYDSAVFVDAFMAGSVELHIGVANLGTTTAVGQIPVDVILSKDKQIDDATDSITRIAGWQNLFGGDRQGETRFPRPELNTAPGYYHVGLRVDPDNAFAEFDETNNVIWTAKPRFLVVTEEWESGSIEGTSGNDVILIEQHGFDIFVSVNGVLRAMDPYDEHDTMENGVFIDAGPGHDKVVAVPHLERRIQVTGNTGNDTLVGGLGDDELSGSFGYDRILGGWGDDLLLGGAVNDYLNGEAGNDLMIGGGGNDRLIDTVGRDHYIGGLGNDVFVSRDTRQNIHNNPDTLSGGPGHDRAQVDVIPSADNLSSIDELLA